MSFTIFDGYAVCADLRAGSNSNDSGMPGILLGASPADESAARIQWDPNNVSGFDTGWVQVDLTVSSTGTTLAVNEDEKIVEYQVAATGEIQWFALRAGVTGANDAVSFRNISFKFYAGVPSGQPDETDTMDDITAANPGTTPSDTETVIEVGPEGSGFHSAVFSAQVRLQSGQQFPDATELFGQVFVFESTVQ